MSWRNQTSHLMDWNLYDHSYGCRLPAGLGLWLALMPHPVSLLPSHTGFFFFFFFILAFVYLRIKARPLTAAPRPQGASQLCAACLGSQAEPPAFPPPLSHGTLALFPPPRTQQSPCPFICSLGPLVGQAGMHLPCFLIFSSITPVSCLSFLPYPQAW